MTKTKKELLEKYPLWNDSKKRKYNRAIFWKYGSQFLKSLQIASKNAHESAGQPSLTHTTKGNDVEESGSDIAHAESRTLSDGSDPPVTDVEVLAPISRLPDEIFSAGSSNSEKKGGTVGQNATVVLGSPPEDQSGAVHASQAIETVTIKGASTKNSSDLSDSPLMGGDLTSVDVGLELGVTAKITNRRKKRAPKRIMKRQRKCDEDGDTSEESNADVRKKFFKISLDEETVVEMEESDQNTIGDLEETVGVTYLHPEEMEKGGKEIERDAPTLVEGRKTPVHEREEGSFDTSLMIDTTDSLLQGGMEELDKDLEFSSEGRITPQNKGVTIPKRKTARKKPGLSSLRSDVNLLMSYGKGAGGSDQVLLSSKRMTEKDGTGNNPVKKPAAAAVTSKREHLENLKEKVLSGESPKLKVVCSQLMPSAFAGDVAETKKREAERNLFESGEDEIVFNACEEENSKEEKSCKSGLGKSETLIDDPQIEKKRDGILSTIGSLGDVPHEGTGEAFASTKSMEVESSHHMVGKVMKMPERVSPGSRIDDVETPVGDTRHLSNQEKEKESSHTAITPSLFGEMESRTTLEESPVLTQTLKQGRRTSLWEGSLRGTPSKVQPYQAPLSSSKKKSNPKEGSKVVTSQLQTLKSAKPGQAARNYRKVAIPAPVIPLNSTREKVEPDQETPTSKLKETLMVKPEFSIGNLVWGRMKGFPWWPGMVVHHYAMKRREPPPPGHIVIQWFGDMKFSQLKFDQVSSFAKHFKENVNMVFVKKRVLYKKAVFQALKVAALQAKKLFGDELPEFPKKDTSDKDQKIFECTFSDMMAWAEGNFEGRHDLVPLPEDIVIPSTPPPPSPERPTEKKVSTQETEKWVDCRDQRIKEMKKGEISLEEFCIGCGSKSLTDQHPLFAGGLCEVCRIEYLETAYMFADDGYQCYCCVCAEGDELALCENKGCYRSFCITCVDLMISPDESKKIKTQDPWICYMCQPKNSFGYLKIREDWPRHLHELFGKDQDVNFIPLPTWPPKPLEERKPIRVLSLFDGIGTGMFVLNELGFKVEVYIASEVNPDAIKVSSVRQKGAITHVGDVQKITSKELAEWGPFDLLIGGSPCNDLSIVNPARKGIYGGSGVLFFEYVRILRLLQLTTPPDRPLFWFFENVVFMGHQDKMTISRFFECNPVLVDAKDLSPAHRARYFWGNLPGMDRPSAALMDSPLRLQDCLEPHCNRRAKFSKIRTITTRANSLKQSDVSLPVEMDGKEDTLWCTELERLFGFPDHYTDVSNLSRGDRQKLLGQCWSVPVIHHLLAPLKDYYQCQ